jgi:hypothetical protein
MRNGFRERFRGWPTGLRQQPGKMYVNKYIDRRRGKAQKMAAWDWKRLAI